MSHNSIKHFLKTLYISYFLVIDHIYFEVYSFNHNTV